MGIKFGGKKRERFIIPTGLYSMDKALHGGLHIPAAYELYGMTHVGKSTIAYYLAGRVRPKGKIALADFEHFDPDYLVSCLKLAGFSGEVMMVDVSDGETALTELRDYLVDRDYSAGILDSIGALIPSVELGEPISPQGYGTQKAKLMAQGMRSVMWALLRNPAGLFMTNHLHPIITLGKAMQTSGGKAIHNLSAIRLRFKTEKHDEDYSIVQGKVDKHRWGGKGGNFKVALVPEMGVHPGLTAAVDAMWYGLSEKENTLKMDGKSYGYIKTLAKKAKKGEVKIFQEISEMVHDKLGTEIGQETPQENSGDEAGG